MNVGSGGTIIRRGTKMHKTAKIQSPLKEVHETLSQVCEYFEERADAEYFTDSPSPIPNEEMRHFASCKEAIELLERYLKED